jgi:hypothetical protein
MKVVIYLKVERPNYVILLGIHQQNYYPKGFVMGKLKLNT